jgi:excisionase family DNA binding protein
VTTVDEELLTAPEAALYLKVSLGAIYHLVARGRIHSVSRDRRLRFYKSDLTRTTPRPAAEPQSLKQWGDAGRRFAEFASNQRSVGGGE